MPGVLVSTSLPDPIGFGNVMVNPLVWQWITGDNAPDEDTFASDTAACELHALLYSPGQLYNAIAYFVGFSYVGDDSKLKRYLPAFHPRYPWLRCVRVSIKGIKFDGEEVVIRANEQDTTKPIYEKYRFHVFYEALPYNVKTDADVSTEWERFITVDTTDETEIFTRDGGALRYNAPGKNWNSTYPTVAAPMLRVRAERTGLLVTAYDIASNFIYNDDGIPTNFLTAKSKVNSATFLSFPADTILFQSFKITKRAQPISPANLRSLQFTCKVEMHFSYTDPPRGIPAETRRGWQLVPGPDYAATTGWYFVSTPAGFGANGLYETYDMNNLLTYRAAAVS